MVQKVLECCKCLLWMRGANPTEPFTVIASAMRYYVFMISNCVKWNCQQKGLFSAQNAQYGSVFTN